MTAALPGQVKIKNRDKGAGHPRRGILRLYFCMGVGVILSL